MTCGEDITVPSLLSVTLILECNKFNGSEPLTWQVYKDGALIQSSSPLSIISATDSDYGTYAFMLSSTHCGSDVAVSRILQEGQL